MENIKNEKNHLKKDVHIFCTQQKEVLYYSERKYGILQIDFL
jgi:hypothetical protein